jgi:hypothetical protein
LAFLKRNFYKSITPLEAVQAKDNFVKHNLSAFLGLNHLVVMILDLLLVLNMDRHQYTQNVSDYNPFSLPVLYNNLNDTE